MIDAVLERNAPLGPRLLAGLGYPMRGGALATLVALTLARLFALLPGIGLLISWAVWLAIWRYAADCLLRTAHGHADAPGNAIETDTSECWALAVLHMLALGACAFTAWAAPHVLWPLVALLALVMPAIDMSLAFDGNLWIALNPLTWAAVVARFGAGYLLPLAINLACGLLLIDSAAWTRQLPFWLGLPLGALISVYLIVLDFHLMGVLVHHRRDRLGLRVETEIHPSTRQADTDALLLDDVQRCAVRDPDAAIALLVERMQGRSAPVAMHQAYRRLLRQRGLHDGLIEHGHLWIAQLLAAGDTRHALGVMVECRQWQADFLPDDPAATATLADLAERLGMAYLALDLCEGYLTRWPHADGAVSCGLLAVRLLAGPLDRAVDAQALLARLIARYGSDPDVRSRLDELAAPAHGAAP